MSGDLTDEQWRLIRPLIDSGDGKAKRLGHELLRPTGEMFGLWARSPAGVGSKLSTGAVRVGSS